MAAHQHPASCLQLNGAPQRGHFFSTVVGTGFGVQWEIGEDKFMALVGCFTSHFNRSVMSHRPW